LFVVELVIGFGWLYGEMVGIVVNNLVVKGGVLFVDSVDKVVCFIWWCDVFNILFVYFVDVLGFMIGLDVECGGIIWYGVKMVSVVLEVMVL